jgi:hypothetical protein
MSSAALKIHKRSGAAMAFHRGYWRSASVCGRDRLCRRPPKNKALNRRVDSVCRNGVTALQKLKKFVIARSRMTMPSHKLQVPSATIALSHYLLG